MHNLRRGLRNIWRSKLRTVTVTALVGIVVCLSITMMAISSAVESQVASMEASVGTQIEIRPAGTVGSFGRGEPLDMAISEGIAAVANVIDVAPTIVYQHMPRLKMGRRMSEAELEAALQDVDLVLPAGVMVAIVGASGSGKTTLLNMIGGLDRPTSGEVILCGQPIHQLSETAIVPYRRKLLGYVFQSYNLIPNLSAIENVELPLDFAGVQSGVKRQRAKACLALAELPAIRYHHRPSQLSGGEQQRVAIARSLANDPQIILADEPTGNLDSKTGRQVVELLCNLAAVDKKTVIVISHPPLQKTPSRRLLLLPGG